MDGNKSEGTCRIPEDMMLLHVGIDLRGNMNFIENGNDDVVPDFP